MRNAVAYDRISCLINGVAESPAITTTDPIATSFPGTMTVPADQCHNLADKVNSVRFDTVERAQRLVKVDLVTWDGTTSRVRTYDKPADKAAAKFGIYLYKASGSNPNDVFLDLPANELVTDVRVVYKNLPLGSGSGDWVDIDAMNTQAFADSGLLNKTNTYATYYGDEYKLGDDPAAAGNGNGTYGAKGTANINFFRTQPDPQVRKTNLTNVSALKPGDTTSWRVSISNGPNGTVPMRPALVDVLPVGLDFVEGSDRWTNLENVGNPTFTKSTVSVNGQDRTKLVWEWPAGTQLNYGDSSPTVTFDTRVTLAASSGAHTGDEAQTAVLFDRDNKLESPAGSNIPTDKWDLNGNGDVTEGVGQSTVGWTVLPSSGATIEKFVKGALDADWTTDGLTNATFDGSNSQVDYRLAVSNKNTLPLADLVIYDVLPYVGDTAIGQSLQGEERGTEWAPRFEGVTSLPAGATVEYSTSANPCRPELFSASSGQAQPVGCDNNWTSTLPADPATVKSLKFNLAAVAPSETASMIEFRTQAPKLTGLKDLAVTTPQAVANNNVAWHTFRVDSAGAKSSLPAAEAPLVSVRRSAGLLGDRVWEDKNRDGLQDADESGVAGITVNLLDAAGVPVLDDAGKAITTVTDKDGNYTFAVPLGEWSVSFTDIPAKYDFTKVSVGDDDVNDSDVSGEGLPTHTVVLTDPIRNGEGSNVNLNLDAGLVLAGVSIVKDDHRGVVQVGDELTYDVTISNSSTRTNATGVVITDTLPAELDFVSATDGGVYDAAAHTVTWNIGTLAASASRTVQVVATVKASVSSGVKIVNGAKVVTDQGCVDPNGCETTDIDHTPAISIVKDDHKQVVLPGQELTYDLIVKNSSEFAAADVVAKDILPLNLTFVSATDGGVYDEATRTVSWSLGSMESGAERMVQIVATVAESAVANETVTNIARVTTEDVCVDDRSTTVNECESIDIDRVPSVSITKDDGKYIVRPGETLDYVLTATNNSDSDAPKVVVKDTLPTNVDFVSSSILGTQSVDDPYTFEWDLGTLKAGESRQITVTVLVHKGLPADTFIRNGASITTDNLCIDNPATEANDCDVTDTDKTPSSAWILKDDHQRVAKPGAEHTYDLTIGNDSVTETITDAVVTDNLPADVEFVSATDGGKLSADGKSVTWAIPSLAPGATVMVKVTVKISETATLGSEIINTAKLEIPGGCDDPEGCETEDRDIVPKLSIVKDDHKETVKPGGSLTYDVTVKNEANAAARDVVITDELPANVTYVSSSDNGSYDEQTRTITWSVGELAIAGQKTVQVTVTVNQAAEGVVVNNAKVTTERVCYSDTGCTATDQTKIVTTPLALTGSSGTELLAVSALLALLAGAFVIFRRARKTEV